MAVVAGVDFGTLSVRVSIVDSERGLLASAVAEYPLHRKREDPEYATQSHEDHMRALAEATREARSSRLESPEIRSRPSLSILPAHRSFRSARICDRSGEYYLWCDHRAKGEAQRSPPLRIRRSWRPSNGAAACIPRSGDSRSCCTGCATILKSASSLLLHLSIATWSPRRFAESLIPRK